MLSLVVAWEYQEVCVCTHVCGSFPTYSQLFSWLVVIFFPHFLDFCHLVIYYRMLELRKH